jgi:preprotein translocase subunit SecA
MFKWLKNLFGDRNQRQLDELWPLVDEINAHVETLESLSDDALRAETDRFRATLREAVEDLEARMEAIRHRLRHAPSRVPGLPAPGASPSEQQQPSGDGATGEADGEPAAGDFAEAPGGDGEAFDVPEPLTLSEREALYAELDDLEDEWLSTTEGILDDLLPEAFAVMKETCRRMIGQTWTAGGSEITWDMVPYDVQLLGGIVLHQGRIAEMKTGEGKTLVAILPIYLNALVGRGVHVVTVNPYLAQRDAEWMGPLFEFHGLTVDCIDPYQAHSAERRAAYRCDITYGTNNEFGFDYLRDNSFVVRPEQLVQRRHHFAIIDEIDSVLIDEARTPLIISGPVPDPQDDAYNDMRPAIDQLVEAQRKLVRQLTKEAQDALTERDQAQAAGDKKAARAAEDRAGLALLRASRGFPKNRRLQKLLQEPGVERLRLQTEAFYLQENAKRMPEVDDALYFALNEKQRAIEMSEKGRQFISRVTGQDEDLFVLPVIGQEIAELEDQYRDDVAALEDEIRGSGEDATAREKRLMEAKRPLESELEEKKRELYTRYSERAETLHAIEQLLKAYTLYEKDSEYIVQDGKVQIVDEHTGRVLEGRRYSEGLHQAIEAKEQVEVQAATQTYATVTLQNYFRMYDKLAGMTGTAETEAEEFGKIYDLDVVVVPTNEPIRREDLDDLVFQTKREKYNAVIDTIRDYHDAGQPVLVGTASVDVSEQLSRLLKRAGIRHNVLNAKRDRAKAEADIVAEAGQTGAVTIATNMAGRGTDIKLGEGVREAGGLAIIGTERHDSRRIDLQLRGRAGRQGDPGVSQFYVSLEDDLMRLFGSDRIAKTMDRLGVQEGEVIQSSLITKSIKRAQSKVEKNNFAIRKRQLEYDDVLNQQRKVIYSRRREALTGDRFHGEILGMLRDLVEAVVDRHYGDGNLAGLREELLRTLAFDADDLDRETFVKLGADGVADRLFDDAVAHYERKRGTIATVLGQSLSTMAEERGDAMPERVYVDFTDGRRILRTISDTREAIETQGQEINDALERTAMLQVIDEKWTDHLRALDEVKGGIGLRAYGQRDPLVEYKKEAFDLFASMMAEISQEVVGLVFRAGPIVEDAAAGRQQRPRAERRRRLDPRRAQERHDSMEPSYAVQGGAGQRPGDSAADRDPSTDAPQQPVTVTKEPGRNDKVVVMNPTTGDQRTIKYKHFHKMKKQGWTLVEVVDA